MVFNRCLIIGTILTAAVMLFAVACAGLQGKTAEQHEQVGSVPKLNNNELLQPSQTTSYVQGEVLVRFAEATNEETIYAFEKYYHVTVKQVLIPARLYLIKITDGSTVQNLIDRLRTNEAIEYAEPNYLRRTR